MLDHGESLPLFSGRLISERRRSRTDRRTAILGVGQGHDSKVKYTPRMRMERSGESHSLKGGRV